MILSPAVLAQAASNEFGHTSAGEIDLLTKRPSRLSGSLGLSLFGSGGHGYNGTLGGTIVKDRVWFFASAEKAQPQFSPSYATPARAIDTKLNAQLGDRQALAATFASTNAPATAAPLPSSFLSLHYTGVLTDSMFFTATFSRNTTSLPQP